MKLTKEEQEALAYCREASNFWKETPNYCWNVLVRLVNRLLQEERPESEQKIKLTLTEEEQEVIKRSKDWLDYYQLGGVFTPHLETCEIICRLLARIDKVAQEPESPQPEVKLIKTGMELTTEEWKAKGALQNWVKSYTGGYSPGSTVGCVAELLAAIDRETSKHADYKKEEQADKPKVVIYWWEGFRGAAVYVQGRKVPYAPNNDASFWQNIKDLFTNMRYEADLKIVEKVDMPPDPNDNGARGYYAPPTLMELEDHFNNLENARRKVRIASLKDELQRLEQEDANA